jgi:cytochrome P450
VIRKPSLTSSSGQLSLYSSSRWRRMRRASSDSFSKSAVRNYHAIQTKEAVLLAWNLLANPADLDKQFRRTAASMIMSVLYDLPPVESDNDPNVSRVKEHMARLVASTTPGAHWVEFLPWMKYIPKRSVSRSSDQSGAVPSNADLRRVCLPNQVRKMETRCGTLSFGS